MINIPNINHVVISKLTPSSISTHKPPCPLAHSHHFPSGLLSLLLVLNLCISGISGVTGAVWLLPLTDRLNLRKAFVILVPVFVRSNLCPSIAAVSLSSSPPLAPAELATESAAEFLRLTCREEDIFLGLLKVLAFHASANLRIAASDFVDFLWRRLSSRRLCSWFSTVRIYCEQEMYRSREGVIVPLQAKCLGFRSSDAELSSIGLVQVPAYLPTHHSILLCPRSWHWRGCRSTRDEQVL